MFTFILIIHILACISLICVILIQQGKGGGLLESFSGVESMFGTKTNVFLGRATTVFAILFIITCLTLAILSKNKSKSVLERIKVKTPAAATIPETLTNQTLPGQSSIAAQQEQKTVTAEETPTEADQLKATTEETSSAAIEQNQNATTP